MSLNTRLLKFSRSVIAFQLLCLSATGMSFAGARGETAILEALKQLNQRSAPESQKAVLQRLDISSTDLAFFRFPKNCEAGVRSTAMEKIQAAPPAVLALAYRALVEQQVLSPGEIDALTYPITVSLQLSARAKTGMSYSIIPESISRQMETDILGSATNGLTRGETLKASIEDFSYVPQGSKIAVRFQITYGNGEIQRLNIEEWVVGSAAPQDALRDLLIAAIEHRKILRSKEAFTQEVNMIEYSLKKLLFVANPQVKVQLTEALNGLPDFDKKFFEYQETSLGRAFGEYLKVKSIILKAGQDALNGAAAAPRQATAPTQQRTNANLRRGAGTIIPAPPAALNWADLQSRPVYRGSTVLQGSRYQDRYYYTNYYSSSDIATLAWFTEPTYMWTHPLFWGVRDNSLLANYLLFQMMTDQQSFQHQTFFSGQQPYNPDLFDRPVEPHYYNSNQTPVVDPWATQPRNVEPIASSFDANNGTYVYEDRSGQPVDLSRANEEPMTRDQFAQALGSVATPTQSDWDTTPTTNGDVTNFVPSVSQTPDAPVAVEETITTDAAAAIQTPADNWGSNATEATPTDNGGGSRSDDSPGPHS